MPSALDWRETTVRCVGPGALSLAFSLEEGLAALSLETDVEKHWHSLCAKNPHEAQFLVRVTLLITNQCYLEVGSWRQGPPEN